MATCLVVALALGATVGVKAVPIERCISGLPADLATQLQPLIQALAEANGAAASCEPSQSGASGLDPPSQQQRDLDLIAEAMALLAQADPGYGYAPSNYGYPTASFGSTAACGPP